MSLDHDQRCAAFLVRPYRPDDAPRLQALYARTAAPFRPEDAVEVAAMRERAERARLSGEHWSPLPADEPWVSEAEHLAFWVAVCALRGGHDRVVGTVGLRLVGDAVTATSDAAERSGLEAARAWLGRPEIGEVRRLRVAPECRRQGVGSALMHELMSWSASHLVDGLVLNTTSAQLPALHLYRKLGFREIGRSYLGEYELVWLQRPLAGYERVRQPLQDLR